MVGRRWNCSSVRPCPNTSCPNDSTCPRKTLCSRTAARISAAARGAAAAVGADDLDGHRVLAHLRRGPPQEHRRPDLALGHQIDAAADARAHLAVGTAGEVDRGGVARPQAEVVVALDGEEVTDPEHDVLEPGDADQLRGPPGRGEPGVEPGLHVDVVVAGPVLLDDLELPGVAAEVLADDPRERRPLARPRRADHGPDAPPDQSSDVGDLGAQVALGRDDGGYGSVGGVATAWHGDLRMRGGRTVAEPAGSATAGISPAPCPPRAAARRR